MKETIHFTIVNNQLFFPYRFDKESNIWMWTSQKLTKQEFHRIYPDSLYIKLPVEFDS